MQSAIDLNQTAKFIVSGSNTTSLNNEIMVGRIKVFYIQPLLYNKFLKIWNIDDNKDSIDNYLKFGSYPKIGNYYSCSIQYPEIIEQEIIDKIIIDDFKAKIDINKFKSLLKEFNNYIGNEINASSIEKSINIARQTIAEYVSKMHKSRIIHLINKYNDKNSKRKYKVYFEDESMIYFFQIII